MPQQKNKNKKKHNKTKKKTVQYTIKKICIFLQHKIIIISYLIWLFYSNFHFSDHHSQIDLLHYGKIIQWDFFFPCTANKQWKNMPPPKKHVGMLKSSADKCKS